MTDDDGADPSEQKLSMVQIYQHWMAAAEQRLSDVRVLLLNIQYWTRWRHHWLNRDKKRSWWRLWTSLRL